ncbi:MAG: DHH family phosphoesterase [Chloroflexota bacterium]|nr:MAG: DHH family phosphoesterase [Chloroflexota bacterium]
MNMTDPIIKIYKALEGYKQLLIIPHNDPDPDATATAIGLCYLVTEGLGTAQIGYRRIIGRSENKALVRYLDHPLQKLDQQEIRQNIPIALVDTQPGAGNNPLPENIPATIVIDHHEWREISSKARFFDIRPEIGASATILTEYLQMAKLDFSPELATALFYGIKTDTMGLGRGASSDDAAAYFFLQPKVDVEALVQIERAQVPITYFMSLDTAIHAARLYDNDLVISNVGILKYPDLGAEIADMLLRLQGVKWVICLGVYKDDLILAVRSRSWKIGAGKLAKQIIGNLGVAGGHGTMAGGQIRIHNQGAAQLANQG